MNPLFEEQYKASFITPSMIRFHLIGLASISFLVFLFYPSQPVSYYLARSVKPEMFLIAFYTILAYVTYLTVKTAVFNISSTKIIGLKEWGLYGKMSYFSYFRGRLLYGLFYTVFLVLLFSPVLIVAASVSAVSPENLAALFLILFLFLSNIYLYGLLLFLLFGKQHWVQTLILWFTILLFTFLSATFQPSLNPILVFKTIQESSFLSDDLLFPLAAFSLVDFFLLISSFLYILYFHRKNP